MTVHDFNALHDAAALDVLLACCGSREWATRMLQARPFATAHALLDTADRSWLGLREPDWLEAFAAHPRIGEATDSAVSRREQAGALTADHVVREQLRRGNVDYEQKFGFIYIVFASGKTPEQMLELLHKRLGNDRSTEIRIAVAEQMKITRLRLRRVLGLEC